MIHLTEQFEFSASHRLHCPGLSDQENKTLFGKCNNPSGHGHNYVVEVTVEGKPDSTGRLLALPDLEQIVNRAVIDRFDHKHLNEDTVEFRSMNPTVENIARVTWDLLVNAVAPVTLRNVRIYETPKTWADYSGA
ncbi:6-carboxytetrahydropterin synthase [bacterium]|nr:6-carboxytetrahydropterin synthase [bacterium]